MHFRWAGVIGESDHEVVEEFSLEDSMKLFRISESKNVGLVFSGSARLMVYLSLFLVFVSSLVADETNEGTEASLMGCSDRQSGVTHQTSICAPISCVARATIRLFSEDEFVRETSHGKYKCE
jgi:hypothetical protein